jgi:hypothetical protein
VCGLGLWFGPSAGVAHGASEGAATPRGAWSAVTAPREDAAVAAAMASADAGTGAGATLSALAAASSSAAAPGSAEAVRAAPRGGDPCKPNDPIGLGPWAPYVPLSFGEIAMPQRGGHTPEHEYDVLVHFHGHEAARKFFVQASRGAVFVGVDLGLGSGAYSKAFPTRGDFERFVAEIRLAMQKRDPQAKIRHLGLSAWSAGYGAVDEILRHGAKGVDAVVLLDGLHAAWAKAAVANPRVEDLSDRTIRPFIDFAKRAIAGETRFVFTHSQIVPPGYPGTAPTADLLLARLGVERVAASADDSPWARVGEATRAGFALWSQRGVDAKAHCVHLANLVPIVRDVIEPFWQTPELDRGVPPTPAPPRDRPGARRGGGDLDIVPVAPNTRESTPSGGRFDYGGLEPVPLDDAPANE